MIRAISGYLFSLVYRAKYQKHIKDFPKLVEVVISAETAEQCDTALAYLGLYKRLYIQGNDDSFDKVTKEIMMNIANYLIDTREHVVKGYHKPEHANFETVRTYPDMNDYLADVLPVIRFKKQWTRGIPSVSMIPVDNTQD